MRWQKAYITYDFGDRKEVVNAPLIADWIVTRADGEYVIDEVAVTDYVESLAAKYDTFGLTREFYTSLGTTVTLNGGDYGWCMDQDATVVALLNALADGYQGTMDLNIYTQPRAGIQMISAIPMWRSAFPSNGCGVINMVRVSSIRRW